MIDLLIRQKDLGFNDKQLELIKGVHRIARDIEILGQNNKNHPVIALILELTNDIISEDYIREKIYRLFRSNEEDEEKEKQSA